MCGFLVCVLVLRFVSSSVPPVRFVCVATFHIVRVCGGFCFWGSVVAGRCCVRGDISLLQMSSLKKRRKNINIVNKLQQWRSFSVDDIKISKPNKIRNPIIDGYDQIKNNHKFNETLL